MEIVRFPSHGGFSVRSIVTFVLAVIATALLWTTLVGHTTHAATDAAWANDNTTILFDNHGYTKNADFKDTTGTIPSGATVFTAPVQTDTASGKQKMLVLYFAPGVDPPTATSVQHVAFDYDNGKISNPHDKQSVIMAPQGSTNNVVSSCSVSGIGWIICPVSTFLGDAMDNVFNFLSDNFVKVQPPMIGNTSTNSLYTAWNIMRTIANIAFVIAFLIIIYSQLTNVGVSNYGLKKLIPRLIVAAVLVNISYYVAAIAIDLSNVIGYSIQNIFNGIRERLFHMTDDTAAGINNASVTSPWTTVTAAVLAGGGVIGGIYYVSGAGLYFLVPLLVGLLLTLIFVVIILAARQAIIIILVIIAPLAFVANLLPNTEKWYKQWQDLFMTMLIFFPAFALVFGGSQLAGQLIIQNAGDNLVTVMFGLAVQIAPLVITPLILKLSGGLLGKIAQIANDPRKGILDTSRNWAKERGEMRRQKELGKPLRPWTPNRSVRQLLDNNKRARHENTEIYKQIADNKWHQGSRYQKIHMKAFEVEVEKQIIEDANKKHIQDAINSKNTRLNVQNARLEAGKRALEHTVKITEATVKEYSAGTVPTGANAELQNIIREIASTQEKTSLQGMRASNADAQVQRQFAEALKNDTSGSMRRVAAGIKQGGMDSVLASATAAVYKADAEDIKNIQDTADVNPGDLEKAARLMTEAIRAGDTIKARAFQNMLVTAGGAGMDKFRTTMIDVGANIPTKVDIAMRENLLANHGAIKAKSNDLIDWAAKGEGKSLEDFTYDGKAWLGLSNEDFILQHPKSQAHALDQRTGAFDAARAISMLDDKILRQKIAPDIIARLNEIAGRARDAGPENGPSDQ